MFKIDFSPLLFHDVTVTISCCTTRQWWWRPAFKGRPTETGHAAGCWPCFTLHDISLQSRHQGEEI